ncbi:MAG: biotin transporter BioY [Deltaproteobacteria bacterium SM23_61]|nr:MAG: biotin transporter BioY [Deltaproteobacteria bacterium SM23_61]
MKDQEKSALPLVATHWGAYRVETKGGRVVQLHPFELDPHPSPIGRSMAGTLNDACRIAQPMVRKGWLRHGPRSGDNQRGSEPFVPVPWDTALGLAAQVIADVKQKHGNEAIFAGSYGWSSTGRFHRSQGHLQRFFSLYGGFTGSVDTYSPAALGVILPRVIGPAYEIFNLMPTWDEIAVHTQLMVAFGGLALKNSQVNVQGVGIHSAEDRQRACRAAGVQFVNISPIRDDTADFLEAEWVALRPNTDTALMLGLAHTLVAENLHDRDFLHRCCTGFERFRAYLMGESNGRPKDAEWAAQISGLNAEWIRGLARRIAARRTLIGVSWSLNRADHGEQPYWMALTLAAMSGSMGKPGGGLGVGYAAMHSLGQPASVQAAGLPVPANPVKTFIPVARISDLLLYPGQTIDYNGQKLLYPHIRLVYWCGGNPFHHHQDLNRLLRAWQQPETIIVHEPWWNSLARHADIVLPCTTPLERNDIVSGLFDNMILASRQVVAPFGEARNDCDIFAALAERLGFRDAFTEKRTEMEWLRHRYESTRRQMQERGTTLPEFEAFWEAGYVENPPPPKPVMLAALRANPEANPLKTPSGKVEIYSETIASFAYDDCPGHPIWLEPAEWLGSPLAERYPLHLISNQPRTRLHSQLDNGVTSLDSKIKGREPVTMHPQDAAARGLREGDVVRVFNERGACLAGLIVSDGVRPGVIQLATGAWYDPQQTGEGASMDKHGNPNMLTIDRGTSKLAQGPIAHTALVEVERFAGELPPITVHQAPATAPS